MADDEEGKSPEAKISAEFAARLEQLGPEAEVRAIVLLQTATARGALKKRPSQAERQAAAESIRRSVEGLLPEIDRILEEHRGKRLQSKVGALGAVSVATTRAGITALVASEHVRAILEDQAVFRVA